MREEELVRRAASGDGDAFEQLLLAHQKQVYNLCLRICCDETDALDLSQEAFIRAWRGLSQYQFDAAFSTWLYRLTRNVCIDFLRSKNRRKTVPLVFSDEDGETEAPLPDSAPGPEELAIDAERRRALAAAMEQLSPEHREILTLRVINGLAYERIAEILSVRTGTVKSRLARARLALKNILKNGNQMDLFTSEESVEEVSLP